MKTAPVAPPPSRPGRPRTGTTSAAGLAVAALLLASAPAAAQDAASVLAVSAGGAVGRTLFADVDGDGTKDLVFVVGGEAPRLVVRPLSGAPLAVGAERTLPLPGSVAAIAAADLGPAPGTEIVLLDEDGATAVSFASRAPLVTRILDAPLCLAPSPGGVPAFFDWGEDVDGDGREELLVPGASSDLLLGSPATGSGRGRATPVIVPTENRLAKDSSGALTLAHRRPRISFHRVHHDGPLSPLFFGDEGLKLVEGDGRGGFGPATRLLLPFRSDASGRLGLLQRTEISLGRIDADLTDDVVIARTRAEGGQLPELRTELHFFRTGDGSRAAAQVLLLPGVLSTGPELSDLDGDGKNDLSLAVFAENMKGRLAREVTGRVRVTWLVYLGRGGEVPFPRSPDVTIDDEVEAALFDQWGLRHRCLFGEDLNGDGIADLVRVSGPKDALVVAGYPAKGRGSEYRFADSPSWTRPLAAKATGTTLRRLAAALPILHVETEDGAVLLALR